MSDFDARELLQGWEDDEPTTAVAQPTLSDAEPEEEAEEPDEEEQITAEGEQAEDDDEEEADGEEEEGDEDGEGEAEEGAQGETPEAVPAFETDDPEVLAYLTQYQGDPLKALRAAAQLRRAYGRQGTDLAAVRQANQELASQIAQQRLLSGGSPLSQEQAEWAEAAAGTVSPGAYVQQALAEGQFDLARAVCTYWAQSDPFNAGRAGQLIDQSEYAQSTRAQQPIEAPTEDIIQALWENVPGMREWEPQMVAVFSNLGSNHHLVQESRSTNPDIAMRALINIFEIAKASSANVQEQRSEIKKRARAENDSAKAKAAVTSAGSSPKKAKETPRRDREIMPGLTLADLETEFARS